MQWETVDEMLIEKQKIKFIQRKLLEWYEINGRDFPWRKKKLTPYKYVIAEVLLQRTKAETVAKFYHQFIESFPNWKSIVQANPQELEDKIKPLGLYRQRSIRLMKLAAEMVQRKGRFPKNRSELDNMPFMGQYIANSMELFVFSKKAPLIDVNMARIIERVFQKRKKADLRKDPIVQNISWFLVNSSKAKEVNWAVLDLASIVCKPKQPNCKVCPINADCKTYKISESRVKLANKQ